MMDFTQLYHEYNLLDASSKSSFLTLVFGGASPLPKLTEGDLAETAREARHTRAITCCPHCNGTSVVLHGTYGARQRYRCKDCHKTFNDLTHTPLAGTHYLDRWGDVLGCMAEGMSLRKIAKRLKINCTTAFFWRHKVLNALKALPPSPLKDIVEADETFLLESCKGADYLVRKARHRGGKAKKRGLSSEQVCVAIAMDRTGNTISETVGKGPISNKALESFLGPHVAFAQTLCADAAGAYRRFTRDHGLELQELNASKGIRVKKCIYHIQHVNGHHHRLKEWLEPFHGVATRWLDNYLAWFRLIDGRRHVEPQEMISALLQMASQQPLKTIVAMLRPRRMAGQPSSKRKVARTLSP